MTAGPPSSDTPSQPSTESYQAAAGASSSDQDTDNDDDDEEEEEQLGAHPALISPDNAAATVPEAAETEQDELLKTIQSSSKKQQR